VAQLRAILAKHPEAVAPGALAGQAAPKTKAKNKKKADK
jgi:hypothetical protein